jgi:hypothetical protein
MSDASFDDAHAARLASVSADAPSATARSQVAATRDGDPSRGTSRLERRSYCFIFD